jgi:putative polyhydroxyalkanoate system protein
MPRINVCKKHNKDSKQTRELAEQLAEKLQANYQLNCQWQGESLAFNRPGLSGDLHLDPGEIRISMKIGILMTPFSKTIEAELNNALDKYLS